jgi:hypothetical protein
VLKSDASRVDTHVVSRSLGLPLLLVSLAVGGVLFATQMRSHGPTSPVVEQAGTQAVVAVAGTSFQAADTAMAAWLAEHGTYAAATLDPSFMVTVARADGASYCLQSAQGTAVEHENGPGGSAAPGPC